MARPDLKQDTKTFVQTLRRIGKSSGNMTLRTTLGWSETRYWRAHANLVEAAKIIKGRGRGGSVAVA
jgi:hypothetical protein